MAYIICYLTVYQIIDFNCGERGREEVGACGGGSKLSYRWLLGGEDHYLLILF